MRNNKRISKPFRLVKPKVIGEVECLICNQKWEVEMEGSNIEAAKTKAFYEECLYCALIRDLSGE